MKRFLFLVVLSACASGPELPKSNLPTSGDQAQVKVLLDRANALATAANKLADVEAVMAAYEDVLRYAPDHRDALIGASRMHYYHANDIVPLSDKDKRMASYLKGREQALRAMALNVEWRTAYEKDNDMVKQLPLLRKEDMPAAYWASVHWAKWGELYGIVRAAIDIPKVKALMEQVNKLDPTYNGNGADRFFVGYWVAIPGFAGKDPKKSKAHYEKAIKESPNMLFNHVTFAEYYARDIEDKALFEETLKKVVASPLTEPKFDCGVAKEEAAGLLSHTKEYFE